MSDLLDLSEMEDEELTPEILPAGASLSIRATAENLRSLFARASAVTPSREVVPGTGYALLEGVPADSGRVAHLRITASDGEQTMSTVAEGMVKVPGSVLLPPKRVLDITKLAPTSVVDLSVVGQTAYIRSGRAQWSVSSPVSAFAGLTAHMDTSELKHAQIAAEPFLKALQVARRAASNTNARIALMQVLIKDSAIIACDGGRLHRVDVPGLDPGVSTTIPVKVVDELIKALAGESVLDLEFDSTQLSLRVGDNTIVAHRLLVEYPDMSQLLLEPRVTNTETLQISRVELEDAIRRVRVNADPDFASVSLNLMRGSRSADDWSAVVTSKDRAGNTAQEAVACYWSGKQCEVAYNHHHLSDALASCESERLTLRLGNDTKTHKTPLLVIDESAGFTGIVQQVTNWI